jgi:hypothetical protein
MLMQTFIQPLILMNIILGTNVIVLMVGKDQIVVLIEIHASPIHAGVPPVPVEAFLIGEYFCATFSCNPQRSLSDHNERTFYQLIVCTSFCFHNAVIVGSCVYVRMVGEPKVVI